MKHCTLLIKKLSNRIVFGPCCSLILAILFLVSGASMAHSSRTASNSKKVSSDVSDEIKDLLNYYDKQIYFTENKGQWPSHVLFKADFHLGQAIVTKEGMIVGTYDPASVAARSTESVVEEQAIADGLRSMKPRTGLKGHGWLMNFMNRSSAMTIESMDRHADPFNYFMGNVSKKNVGNYKEVWYRNVYDRVDVRYYPSPEGTLEYDIICKPGFDNKNLAIKFDGIEQMKVNQNGHLVLHTSVGDVDFPAPVVYQKINGVKKTVAANYEVSNMNELKFQLGSYDVTQPLIIDPIALRWATWVNTASTGDNHGHGIWVDPIDHAIYMIARVDGATNLITTGALDSTAAGGVDLIVGKYLEPATIGGTGTRVWQTYIGGGQDDNPYAIEQGPDGNLYITGYTGSTDYPLSLGSGFGGSSIDNRSGASNSNTKIFITKINKTGTGIKSSVVGGSGNNNAYDLRINENGDIIICGGTSSANLATLYPGTGATNGSSGTDALVFKINQDLSTILWMRNFGGTGTDQATILSQNVGNGDIYVGGYTTSSNFPTLSPRQSTLGGTRSGFLQKLNSLGDRIWSSYFQSANSQSTSILCMEFNTTKDQLYFGGITSGLAASNLPGGTYDLGYNNGTNDFFVSRIDTSQSNLISTYIGGSGNEVNLMGLNTDLNNDVYIFGYTNSTNFPVTADSLQSNNRGNNDKIFAKFSFDLATLKFSTYYGGTGDDYDPVGERGIKFSDCRIYTIVTSKSNNIPLTAGALNTTRTFGANPPYEPGIVVWANPPDLVGNSILGNQTICAGAVPGGLTGSVPSYVLPTISRNNVNSAYPTSLNSAASYQWQISTDSSTWNNIAAPGGIQQNLSGVTIGPLFAKTYFRRIIGGDACILPGVADQVITVDLPHSSANISICDGESYTPPGGVAQTESGIYVTTVKTEEGCDSTITTNLIVNPKYSATQYLTICNNETYPALPWGGTAVAGDNIHNWHTYKGCDSIQTINLTVNPAYSSTTFETICSNETFPLPWGGLAIAGDNTFPYQTLQGCDSSVTINLTIKQASPLTQRSVKQCDSYELPWGGTATTSGDYSNPYLNINGCDSLVKISVTITHSSPLTESSVIRCVSYDLPWGGSATSTGDYSHPYQNIEGCDSTVTIHVTINNVGTPTEFSVTECNSALLPWGELATESGDFSHPYENIDGCDSIVTAHVTINQSYHTILNPVTYCDSYALPWGGFATTTDTYEYPYESIGGCDSLVSIHVTINGSYEITGDPITACDNYLLAWEPETLVTVTGNYSHTYSSIQGCDSVVTIHVTINPSYDLTGDPVTACGSYTLPWDSTVTLGGIYSNTYRSVEGCDSTVSINVTINPEYSTDLYPKICFGDSYTLPWGPSVGDQDTYSWNFHSINGCDSIITVHLTVNALPNVNVELDASLDCSTDEAILNGSSTTLNATLLWVASNGGNIVSDETTGTPTVDAAGTYTLTVTDPLTGCHASGVVTVTPCEELPNCLIYGDTTICQGECTTLSAPTGYDGYLWNNGSTSRCITTNTGGTYCVTVTTNNHSVTCCVHVTVLPKPVACITGNIGICSGESTLLCAPIGNLTYHWNTGATTQCILVSTSGLYAVTVTNTNGCASTSSVCVTVSPLPVCSITGNTTICDGQTTTLCAPYSCCVNYLWNTGETTRCIEVGDAGTYTLTVTNRYGCSSTCTETVNVIPAPPCQIAGNSSICPGGSSQLCGPAGQAQYLWNTGATTRCINIDLAGTYTLTVTGANGCRTCCSRYIAASQPPSCSISGCDNSLCPGQSENLCAAQGYAGYLWNTGATTRCISVNSAGCYTVTVTNGSGCSSTCSKTITVGPAPSCHISGCDNTLCPGQSENLCAPSGYAGYLWNTGATTKCITVSNAGTYTVTVTNSNGCTSSCSKEVNVSQPPSCHINGCDNTLCPGETASLCAPSGYAGYLWNTGATTKCITVGTSGTYTVTITTQNGCTSSCSKEVTVSEPLPCDISGTGSFLCQGQSGSLCATAGYASYLWNTGATTQCIGISVSGTYTVTVTNQSGCSSTCSQSVTSSLPPSCTITGCDHSLCNGESEDICAPQGYSGYLWNTGETSRCISVSSTGTYTVTVTNAGGCTSSCSKTVTVNQLPSCHISGCDNSLCPGQSENLCAPVGYESYLWNTGATTQCINVNSAGTYTVTVTNAGGCTSTCSKCVTVSQPPSCHINGCDNTLCPGESENLCAPSGYEGYLWNTGETTRCITVNSAGTYTVTVTNDNGCTSTCSKTVSVSEPPSCNISGTGNLLCQGQTGSLCAPAGYPSYLWSTGATTQCIPITTGGTYSVTVTNNHGCSSTCDRAVASGVPPVCEITGGDNTLCPGESDNLCAPAGYDGYLWNTGATTQCISADAAGTYTVTVTNGSGCTSSCSTTINVSQPPVCHISGCDNSLCPGQSDNLCAAAGYDGYLWNTGETTQCISVSSAGTYTVTVTNSNGCTSTCCKTIQLRQPPSCHISGCDNSLCPGESQDLCAQNGYDGYLWNTGETTRCISVNNAGTYTVTVTDNHGCTSSCSKEVTIASPPTCDINGTGSFLCQGQTGSLCATAGYASYLWNTGASTQCISITVAGTYTVTVTNKNGCTSTCSASVASSQPPVCEITGGDNAICQGATAELCAIAGYDGYLWNTGATTQCITVGAGTYTVTVTNGGGCTSSCSKTVTESTPPSCHINGCDNSLCPGQSENLCAPAGYASYAWSTGATTQCISVDAAGSYTVTVTNGDGCSSTCSKTVSVSQPPSCDISGCTSICQGQTTSLCAPAGCSSYLWSNGRTTRCISVSCAGTYTVTVTNHNGCSSTCSKTVTVTPRPSATITGDLHICHGQSTQLCAPQGAASYHWNTGATTQCITVTCGGRYSVTVANGNGCSRTASVCVTVSSPVSSNICGNTHICQGQSTSLCAPSGCGLSYTWNTGSHSRCINVCQAGTYTVTVTNQSGCSSTSSVCVTISTPPSCTISGNTQICQGQSTTLSGPSGCATYHWSNGATTQCITVSCAGNYSLTTTNAGGCSRTCNVCVTLSSPPSSCISGNTYYCQGSSTTLCAPSGCASYHWNTGATTRSITVSCPGTYCVTVTNAGGCSSSSSVCVRSQHCGGHNGCDSRLASGITEEGTFESVAYPNPFSSTTTIEFKNKGEKAQTVVEIYGLDGAKISELYNNETESNELYRVNWNAEQLPNGLYMYRIICGDKVVTGRLMLDK